jgi:hypothetical protein
MHIEKGVRTGSHQTNGSSEAGRIHGKGELVSVATSCSHFGVTLMLLTITIRKKIIEGD